MHDLSSISLRECLDDWCSLEEDRRALAAWAAIDGAERWDCMCSALGDWGPLTLEFGSLAVRWGDTAEQLRFLGDDGKLGFASRAAEHALEAVRQATAARARRAMERLRAGEYEMFVREPILGGKKTKIEPSTMQDCWIVEEVKNPNGHRMSGQVWHLKKACVLSSPVTSIWVEAYPGLLLPESMRRIDLITIEKVTPLPQAPADELSPKKPANKTKRISARDVVDQKVIAKMKEDFDKNGMAPRQSIKLYFHELGPGSDHTHTERVVPKYEEKYGR